MVGSIFGEPSGFLEGLVGYDAAIPPWYIAGQNARFQKHAFAICIENCHFNMWPRIVPRLS
jgi:hypothetical protein